MAVEYAELRARSTYSFLRAASQPEVLMERAVELGLHSLAITDYNGVYGMPRAYGVVKSGKNQRTRLIVGSEVLPQGLSSGITLLAQTRRGYGWMCRLLTAVHADKPKGEGFLAFSDWERLARDYPGSDEVFVLLDVDHFGEASCGAPNDWREFLIDHCKGQGSSARMAFALSRRIDGRDRERSAEARRLEQRYGVPIVASNDVYYHAPEKRRLQDALTAIRNVKPLTEMGRGIFSNAERYLKSPTQMAALFKDWPEALRASVEIAETCTFCPSELKYQYPSEWIPQGMTAQQYLRERTERGAEGRYPSGIPDGVRLQLEHELTLVGELGFADYFLTIWDIVRFARERGILCQGRGSAANSIICYCLGITSIDPVKMDLLFERFISAERGEPPDIDVDFEHERREEVIQYIYQRYGRDRAAMVAAVQTYRSKSVARDLDKVFIDLKNQTTVDTSSIYDELKSLPRHLSIHSGGFTLSAGPLVEIVPVEPARMEGRTIIQWDKNDLDALGLLKIDVLSLGMLSAVQKTFAMVARTRGVQLEMATVPADDPETYAMIRRADTVGVFQIESRGQMNMLHRLQPENFYDIVVQVAIVRPGPIQGQMVHPYLKRRRGLEPEDYPDPRLIPILKRTLGVPLFQEQVMKMAIVLAGFSPGEADELRRAIAAWRSSGSIEVVGQKLMRGLLASGLPDEFVRRIFEQIKGFSEYGFPESHAASFGLIAYVSSYLKCHFPAEFTASIINSLPMGFYSAPTLLEDARRHGVEILPIDPRVSEYDCSVARLEDAARTGPGTIRLGLRMIQGLSRAESERILSERAREPFASFDDFLRRADLRPQVLERLALGDVFSVWGVPQREALWRILHYRSMRGSLFEDVEVASEFGAQQTLFAGFEKMKPIEALFSDYRAYGYSMRGHPMELFRRRFGRTLPPHSSREVKELSDGRTARSSGLVICKQRPQTGKGIVFATLEDEHGFFDAVFKEEIYLRHKELLKYQAFLKIVGRVQRDRGAVSVLVREVAPLFTELSRLSENPAIAVPDSRFKVEYG